MSDDTPAVPPEEAALRDAWREVCMVEYRITGDMTKATAFADQIEKTYRDNVRVQVLAEVTPEDKYASRERLAEMLWDNYTHAEKAAALNAFSRDVARAVRSAAIDRLAKLEAAGVDNWEGYGHALRDEDEDETY